MPVDATFAAWLRADALYSTAFGDDVAETWGDRAVNSSIISPFATKADADVESARQADFLAGPLARDTVTVAGQRSDLLGKPVQLAGDRLGYEKSPSVFVIAADETQLAGSTMLTVLRRLT